MALQWIITMLLVSAALALVMSRPGLWGLAGATIYAGSQMVTLLSGEGARDRRSVALAWWKFWIAVFFGFVAAEGFGPTIVQWTSGRVQPQAVWLLVGLSVNGAWPVVERAVGKRLRKLVDAIFGER